MSEVFPFSAEKLARLTALAREINRDRGPAPTAKPIQVDGEGFAYVPKLDGPGTIGMMVHPGLHVAWSPRADPDGLLLVLFGGPHPLGDIEDGFVAFLTWDGIRKLAADLAGIAEQRLVNADD